MKTRFVLALLSLLVLLACNVATDLFSSSKTIDETPTTAVDLSVTETAPVTDIQPCLVTPGEPQLDQAMSFDGIPASILNFLNAGGDPEDLVATLETINMAAPISPTFVRDDFTGDGYPKRFDQVRLRISPGIKADQAAVD